jgi:carboxyl-terminal processing protease
MGYVVLASTNLGELTLPEGDRVGYLLFNDHILPATDALTAAVRRFQTAGISDLVLDLRYNGGGFLSVASRLAYMLSGPATDNQTFFRLAFNDKHRDDDYNFGFMNLDNQDRALPRLNLKRVYVIIDSRTCSASEAVINGLRPFLPVYTIGSATCGKPYGFIQTDYCDKTYFAVRFQGANRDGESVPETGFSADCPARDDPDYALGEPGEAMLASALTLRRTGACPRAEAFQRRAKALPPPLRPLPREPWRDNLIAP